MVRVKLGLLLIVLIFSVCCSPAALAEENVMNVVEGLLAVPFDNASSVDISDENIYISDNLTEYETYFTDNSSYKSEEYNISEPDYPESDYVFIDREGVYFPVNVSVSNQDLRLGVNKVIGEGGECLNLYVANSSTSWPMVDACVRFTFWQSDYEFSHGFNVSGSSMSKMTIPASYLVEEGIEVGKPFQVKVELLSGNIDSNFEDNFYVGFFKIEEGIGINIYEDIEEESAFYNSDYLGENNSSAWYYENLDYSSERSYYETLYLIKKI